MLRQSLRIAVCLLGVGGFVCTPVAFAAEPQVPEKLFTRSDAIVIHINKLLAQKIRNHSKSHVEDHGALVEYYGEPDSQLVWVSETGLNDRALDAIHEIKNAAEWGLRVSDYITPEAVHGSETPDASIKDVAELELAMSYVALAYARHASGGRIDPSDLSENIDYKPPHVDPLDFMKSASAAGDIETYLRDLHPTHDQFLRLKALLAKVRGGDIKEPDVIVIPKGKTIRPGDFHADVVLIRHRLEVYAPDGADPAEYDEEVVEAVRAFQKEHRLRPDGYIGQRTRSAFNRGIAPRPADEESAILVHMERWRWVPRELGEFHVHANIPEFMVRIRKGSEVMFEERVVAGKVANKTPAFSDKMERVVFNPYWYPPRSIIMNEIIPGAQRSSSFLRRQGLQVVNARGRVVDPYNIDWYSSQPLRYQLRQPPGRSNALGVVKFLFPNKHSVYMHDTPSKSLFNKEVRTFSHGCVRVRNPRKMAEVIVGELEGWGRPRIDKVIAQGANHKLELSQHVPVHVTYLTMWVDEEGNAKHFDDVYGHDPRTIAALEGRPFTKDVNRKTPTTTNFVRRQRQRQQQQFPSFFDALFNN